MPSAMSQCEMKMTGIVWSGVVSGRHPWKISVADHHYSLQGGGELLTSPEE